MRKSIALVLTAAYVIFRIVAVDHTSPTVATSAKTYATKLSDHVASIEASAKVLEALPPNRLTYQTLNDFGSLLKPVRYILVFDASGSQIAQSFTTDPQQITITDRPYFQDAVLGRFHFWYGPYDSRNALRPSYSYVVRLGKQEFRGLLLFVVPVDRITQLCVESLSTPQISLSYIDRNKSEVVRCGADVSDDMQDSRYVANFEYGQIVARQSLSDTKRTFYVLLFVEALALYFVLGLCSRFRTS